MPEFHGELRGAAAHPTREVPFAQIERRLRARRRTRIGVPVVAATVLIVGLVTAATALTRDEDAAHVTTMGSGESTAYGVAVELPEGWVNIPTVSLPTDVLNAADVLHFTQLVAAGTARVSSVDSCPNDQASASDAFVTVSELDPGLSIDPTTERPLGSRPADFAIAPVFSEGSCRDATNVATSQEYSYLFIDQGRVLGARVVLGRDAPPTRRDEAYAILNSLRVEEGQPAPTVAPTTSAVPPPPPDLPVTTVPPADDEAAIRAAFLGWIDTKPPEDGAAYVEDGDAIRDTIAAAARTNPQNQRYTGRVDSVSLVSATEADVTYTILFDGSPSLMGRQGRAVRIDGVWKVSRETVCELEASAGVQCPPRSG